MGLLSVATALSMSELRAAQTLSKADQMPGWHTVTEPLLVRRGFLKWKARKGTILLRNSDFQVACEGSITNMAVKCSQPMPQTVIDYLSAKKQKQTALLQKAAIQRKSSSKYTPLMDKNLQPLNPKVEFENEEKTDGGTHETWGRTQDIDDEVDEGEQDNGAVNSEQESDHDIEVQNTFLNHIDVGPGNAIDEENERDTQHKPGRYKKSIRNNKKSAHYGLVDVPYVDAGTDRVVNERMFAFFKKHPQYHTPKAHWITADRWKQWMVMSGDEENEEGLSGKAGLAGPPGEMWKKDCPERIQEEWPDAPEAECKHFAVSPVGFWGCETLFEDGTCQKTHFYQNIRWDGLDAYPLPKANPDAQPGQQFVNPKAYQDEILPGGNPP